MLSEAGCDMLLWSYHCTDSHIAINTKERAAGSTPGATGSQQSSCVARGETVLDYYGYTINTGVLIAALATAYIISHIGSYLALSRVHKAR